ncbi:c-type cytochrome [Pusillimonas noertemannii]|uniref:Quinol:cytochrome c oxidoreductase monoheme cytochrome subunit n=1 Tax=Pusillimonas noertemannii TaxID=305977 RepID=A0A2U1CK15_9BURK|nr:cytochrome c [Pusillimonas noertemannii]PVY61343.1 quinol:cytochrome c oxidoreductase monoheme cytochrome subunit [Pusillimonas noertemannii]
MRIWIGPLLLTALALALSGCERSMRDMYDQPRGKAHGSSALFSDGAVSRTPPAGTVIHARGARAGSSSGRLGADATARRVRDEAARTQPYPLDMQLLKRGQERFSIYCLPCHSAAGDGDGRVVRRGFPSPPSYHSDRLRQATDRYVYDVISRGYGVMPSYADRIDPADRWAIVAYVRALQLSRHARMDRLPRDIAEKAREALPARPAMPEQAP